MNRTALQRFAFTILLVVASGCRDSKPAAPAPLSTPVAAGTPQRKLASSNSDASAVGKPMTTSYRPPDLGNAVPAKTFQVQLPVLFTSDQLPEDSIVEFRFTAKAGQVLHVRMREDEWYYYLLVQKQSGDAHGLIPGGDSEGNRLYTLPETRDYRVVGLHTASRERNGSNAAIQLALLNIDDPLVDPGIRPDQISINAGDLAASAKWTLIPYSHFEGYAEDPWPSHLALEGAQLEFRVMPIVGYKKIVSSEDMDKLQAALQSNGKGADPRKFPYSGHNDAALEVATRPKFLQGQGWRGLRWIGQYSQDYVCGFKYLTYVFEGISDDGKFFFMMQRGMSNAEVTGALDRACTDGLRGKKQEEEFKAFFDKEMPPVLEKDISAADPVSFQPGLDRLDAIALSLKLNK